MYARGVDENLQAFIDSIDFSAFMSAGIAATDQKDNYRIGNIDDTWSGRPDTMIGLQFGYQVNDKTKIVSQLVAKSVNDWDFEAEYAFISYDISNEFSVRAGRLRLPLFLYSDYLEVGYAYPWVRPPVEVYSEPDITNYDGFDLTWQKNLGEWDLRMNGFYGSVNDETTRGEIVTKVKIKNEMGANATLSNGDWTFRISYTRGDQDSCSYIPFETPGMPYSSITTLKYCSTEDDAFSFTGIGARYNANNLLLISEFTRFKSVDETVVDNESFYLTAGYQLNKVMPHITFARIYNPDDSKVAITSKEEQQSITLGSRFELASNLALKAEVSYISEFNGTNGSFLNSSAEPLDDEAYVYTLVLDAAF